MTKKKKERKKERRKKAENERLTSIHVHMYVPILTYAHMYKLKI